MKSLKKILLGIAILLFGFSITAVGTGTNELIYIRWIISFVGLFVAFAGYLRNDDRD